MRKYFVILISLLILSVSVTGCSDKSTDKDDKPLGNEAVSDTYDKAGSNEKNDEYAGQGVVGENETSKKSGKDIAGDNNLVNGKGLEAGNESVTDEINGKETVGNNIENNVQDSTNNNTGEKTVQDDKNENESDKNAIQPADPGESLIWTEPGIMRDMTSYDIVMDMGLGWNLGNTFDACGDWISGGVSSYETAWGSPITTRPMFENLKKMGFRSVRIPVAWSNMMKGNYTISTLWMDRVEEVVNFALDSGLYVVLNIHWDGGWITNFSKDYDETMKKYTRIWEQICERFKNYPDYLIFESMNEEGHFDDIWNRYSNYKEEDKIKAYDILNGVNQKFVDIVRSSGSNNERRHLLIAGYATDIDLTIDPAYKMPEDPANRLMISVHYYTPSTFTILEEDADWGKAVPTWGTEADYQRIKDDFEKMKVHFHDKGYPVIVGEFGATKVNKDPDSVRNYITAVAKTVYEMNMCPMLWDASSHYNRLLGTFRDEQLLKNLQEIIKNGR